MSHRLARAATALGLAALDTLWIAATGGWVYGAAVAVIHPDSMPQPYGAGLGARADTVSVVCFVVATASHLARGLVREQP